MCQNFTKFLYACGHDSVLLCNTLHTSVLWMMSCFHIMVQIQIQAISKLSTVTLHIALGAKSSLTDYLVYGRPVQ